MACLCSTLFTLFFVGGSWFAWSVASQPPAVEKASPDSKIPGTCLECKKDTTCLHPRIEWLSSFCVAGWKAGVIALLFSLSWAIPVIPMCRGVQSKGRWLRPGYDFGLPNRIRANSMCPKSLSQCCAALLRVSSKVEHCLQKLMIVGAMSLLNTLYRAYLPLLSPPHSRSVTLGVFLWQSVMWVQVECLTAVWTLVWKYRQV